MNVNVILLLILPPPFSSWQNNFGFPEWCGKPKSIHWAGEASFGRTAKANVFSSYRLSRPIIILFVPAARWYPAIWGQEKAAAMVCEKEQQRANDKWIVVLGQNNWLWVQVQVQAKYSKFCSNILPKNFSAVPIFPSLPNFSQFYSILLDFLTTFQNYFFNFPPIEAIMC